MKRIIALVSALVIMVTLAGCSMFSSGGKDYSESGDIKLCDTFTHKDPEGMKYAARYAYCTAPDDPYLVEGFKEDYGLDVVSQYYIIYADENDKPLGQFEYYVCKDEENAQKMVEAIGDDFYTADGCVVVGESDAEATQEMIDANIMYGGLTDGSCKAYAEFTKEIYMFIDVQ